MVVNLRQRQRPGAKTKTEPAKRKSSRIIENVSHDNKVEEEDINIDSESESESKSNDDEDIQLESDSENENEILDHSVISVSDVEAEELEEGNSSEDSSEEGSEDDREIRRILKKTEAETRNLSLTARQRAKLNESDPKPMDESSSTPVETTLSSSKNTNTLTDEQSLKKSEKSRRRKLQRDLKLEETKRATIDRLLQKQPKIIAIEQVDTETSEQAQERLEQDLILKPGMIRYIDNALQSTLTFPDEETYENCIKYFKPVICTSILNENEPLAKGKGICQVCNVEPSKYTHPSKGKVFCSLKCYKSI